MTKIIVTVCPTAGKAGQFDASVDGRYIVTSRSPFTAACRVLITHGFDPECEAVMRHAGCDADALRGRLGTVAGCDAAEQLAKTGQRRPLAGALARSNAAADANVRPTARAKFSNNEGPSP